MLRNTIYLIAPAILPLAFYACGLNPNGRMGNWDHMMGYGYTGGFMWLFALVLVGVVVYFLLRVAKSKGAGGSIMESALDILQKRYAKGDIDKEEFERKKRIWNPNPPHFRFVNRLGSANHEAKGLWAVR